MRFCWLATMRQGREKTQKRANHNIREGEKFKENRKKA